MVLGYTPGAARVFRRSVILTSLVEGTPSGDLRALATAVSEAVRQIVPEDHDRGSASDDPGDEREERG
jgi:hypothetical protein